jgi:hypothetical protein
MESLTNQHFLLRGRRNNSSARSETCHDGKQSGGPQPSLETDQKGNGNAHDQKIMLSAAIILSAPFALATRGAFAHIRRGN